ncbi:MAG: YncE family protein, partial [Chloroflexi bacterium]|nr:YncE family protein [Chloroflexota bacterium]
MRNRSFAQGTRSWLVLATALAFVVVLAALILVSRLPQHTVSSAPWMAPSSAEEVSASEPVAVPTPGASGEGFPSILYVMYDWRNQDYRTEYPEYGPIGSHIEFTWDIVNPAPGVFNWTGYDRYLAKARGMTVELASGQVISKPVQFTVMIYGSEDFDRLRDFTPEWVYQRAGREETVDGRRVGYALRPEGCPVAGAPAYDDPVWREAFAEMVRAFGARYGQDPQVAGIWIGVGIDDETQPTKQVGLCDYPAELAREVTCGEYMDFIREAMNLYAEAFPQKPLWIQAGPGACTAHGRSAWSTRKQIMEWAVPLGIGYKNNGLQPDKANAVGYQHSAGWESLDIADRLWRQVPIAFEPAYSAPMGDDAPVEYAYWMVLNALAHHADFIDVQYPWLEALAKVPEIFDLLPRSLGVDQRTTTDVWIVFRDREYPPLMFNRTGMGGDPGDWEFFLQRLEGPGTRTVHLVREDLPSKARRQPYSRHARRTDLARGGVYIPLDVDDRWRYGGTQEDVRYLIRVWYLDQGRDSWAFEYADAAGEVHQRKVQKGGSNRWRIAEWILDDLVLMNGLPGGSDVRLNSLRDGDDTFHKVLIRALPSAELPTPTPTSEPSPTYPPSPISTPTPTATPVAVPTPTFTASPSPTPTPRATPTARPSPPGTGKVCVPSLIASIPVGAHPKGVAAADGKVFVGLFDDSAVAVLDANSLQRLATISTAGGHANGVAYANGKVYMANRDARRVSVIDVEQAKLLGAVDVGSLPWGMAADGDRVYVANFGDHSVTIIDARADEVVRTVSVSLWPAFIAAADGRVYVTHLDGRITILDREGQLIGALASVARDAWGVAVDPEGGRLFVSSREERTIISFDLKTWRKLKVYTLPAAPYVIAYNPTTDHLFAVAAAEDAVYTLDVGDGRVLGKVPVGRQDATEGGQGVSVWNDRVFITNYAAGTVSILDESDCRERTRPTATPSPSPTATPTVTLSPTPTATASATPSPTASPTVTPSATSTDTPTATPSATPTPTVVPTDTPSPTPSPTPSATPTPEATYPPSPIST